MNKEKTLELEKLKEFVEKIKIRETKNIIARIDKKGGINSPTTLEEVLIAEKDSIVTKKLFEDIARRIKTMEGVLARIVKMVTEKLDEPK